MAPDSKGGTRILFGYNQLLCATSLAEGGEFGLSVFEDFNRFVEAVVLYDKVVLIGEYNLPSSSFYSELAKAGVFDKISDQQLRHSLSDRRTRQSYQESMCRAFGVNVLNADDCAPEILLDRRISPNLFDRRTYNTLVDQTIECNRGERFNLDRYTLWLTQNVFETRHMGGHFYYVARALLYSAIADTVGADYAPDFLRLPVAALTFADGSRAIPKSLYDALVGKLQSEIEALALLGMPVAIFVPPLTAEVLAKAPKPQDYPFEILALREKFAKFRKVYGEFTLLLKDPEATVKDKIAAKRRLFDSIEGVIKSGDGQHALNVRTIWERVLNAELSKPELSLKMSLSAAVSLLLEQILKERTKGRAKALFDLWTDTLNLRNYGGLIERTFQTSIDATEVEYFKRYSESVRSLIRSAAQTS